MYILYVMKSSNISYLRNHLREVLICVREGESVTVLDRNKPVARLVPYGGGGDALSERLKELLQTGLLTHSQGETRAGITPPIKLDQPVSLTDYIKEDRDRQ